MEKKLTKAQLKEMEERQEELRGKRRNFVEAVKGYWKDIEAAESYLKTKGERLEFEEKERLFRRYDALAEYNLEYNDKDSADYRMWCIIRYIVKGNINYTNYRGEEIDKYFTIKMEKDDLLVDDIIWNINELKLLIKEARKYGFKNIFYTNNSSGAMEVIGEAISLGGKITNTLYNTADSRFGLIINIEDCILDEKIEDEKLVEEIKAQFQVLGDRVKYEMYTRDIVSKILIKYNRIYNLVPLYELVEKIRKELIVEVESK